MMNCIIYDVVYCYIMMCGFVPVWTAGRVTANKTLNLQGCTVCEREGEKENEATV